MISGERWPPQAEHIRGCGSGCFVERKTDPRLPDATHPPRNDRSKSHTRIALDRFVVRAVSICATRAFRLSPAWSAAGFRAFQKTGSRPMLVARWDERRVGKECVSPCNFGGLAFPE